MTANTHPEPESPPGPPIEKNDGGSASEHALDDAQDMLEELQDHDSHGYGQWTSGMRRRVTHLAWRLGELRNVAKTIARRNR